MLEIGRVGDGFRRITGFSAHQRGGFRVWWCVELQRPATHGLWRLVRLGRVGLEETCRLPSES